MRHSLSRGSTRRLPITDVGLNNSDTRSPHSTFTSQPSNPQIDPNVETLRFNSRGTSSLLTPLASFSADDLAQLRRTSPDAYRALLQYEQLCRREAAQVEAKELELQRCIDVGQEVLGQLDEMQKKCAELVKERDAAVERGREWQQKQRRPNPSAHFAQTQERNPPPQPQRSSSFEDWKNDSALRRDAHAAVEAARRAGVRADAAEAKAEALQHQLASIQSEASIPRTTQQGGEGILQSKANTSATQQQQQQQQQPVWVPRPSVALLAACAQAAALHNVLLDTVVHLSRLCTLETPTEGSPISPAARLHASTIPTVTADSASAMAKTDPAMLNHSAMSEMQTIERWLHMAFDAMDRLAPELSSLAQRLDERQRRTESARSEAEQNHQLALSEAQGLSRENAQLRDTLAALREEVHAIDAQTNRLCNSDQLAELEGTIGVLRREIDAARRQAALETSKQHERLEDTRKTHEAALHQLRAALTEREAAVTALTRQLRESQIEAAKLQDAAHRATQRAREAAEANATHTVPIERYEELETELMQAQEATQAQHAIASQLERRLDTLRHGIPDRKELLEAVHHVTRRVGLAVASMSTSNASQPDASMAAASSAAAAAIGEGRGVQKDASSLPLLWEEVMRGVERFVREWTAALEELLCPNTPTYKEANHTRRENPRRSGERDALSDSHPTNEESTQRRSHSPHSVGNGNEGGNGNTSGNAPSHSPPRALFIREWSVGAESALHAFLSTLRPLFCRPPPKTWASRVEHLESQMASNHRAASAERAQWRGTWDQLARAGDALRESVNRVEVLEARVLALQTDATLQRELADAATEEAAALRHTNTALERRLEDIEGEREPLRRQLQCLLLGDGVKRE